MPIAADMSQVKDDEIDAAAEQYTVFGRVTPVQKKQLVEAFHRQKRTVAMTGDGVNDLLALKEADCSIAVDRVVMLLGRPHSWCCWNLISPS